MSIKKYNHRSKTRVSPSFKTKKKKRGGVMQRSSNNIRLQLIHARNSMGFTDLLLLSHCINLHLHDVDSSYILSELAVGPKHVESFFSHYVLSNTYNENKYLLARINDLILLQNQRNAREYSDAAKYLRDQLYN